MASSKIEIPDYLSEPMQRGEQSPLSVLDDFAEQLAKKTGGFVEGKVNVAPFLGMTRYTFYLVIPAVNDYTDPLFYVWNEVANQEYPVMLLQTGAMQENAVPCEGAQALIDHTNDIFREGGTKARVQQWIELAKERSPAK